MTKLDTNTALLTGAGALISVLLAVLSWFLIDMADSNTVQHQEILEEIKALKHDIGDIELIIIEYHPKSIGHFIGYNSMSPTHIVPKPYMKFNCIVYHNTLNLY